MTQETIVRRRNDAEETRRRVLDAVVQTVIDIGYYKASSNEIARRAGVTWGSIQHLFGSRDQLMLDVVNDIGSQIERRFANAVIKGETLEERLAQVLKTLALFYEQDAYLVQMQVLLELSANPNLSGRDKRAVRLQNGDMPDHLAQPLLTKAMGEAATDYNLVMYVFLTFRGYLTSCAIARRMAHLPKGAVRRFIGQSGDDSALRDFLVRGVAEVVRGEAKRQGLNLV